MDELEFKVADHAEHDEYMPNVYPPRKMFSSAPTPAGLVESVDDRTGGMRIIRRLAEVIEADGKLVTPKK